MSHVLTSPSCSVSPLAAYAAGCRCVAIAGSSETWDHSTDDGGYRTSWHKGFQNYKYQASRVGGWEFAHFEIHITEVEHLSPNGYDNHSEYDDTEWDNPYVTDAHRYSGSDSLRTDIGAAWYNDYESTWRGGGSGTPPPDRSYTNHTSQIEVVAVFVQTTPPTPEGPYLLYDDATGQLLYAPSSGQLIYGGNIT